MAIRTTQHFLRNRCQPIREIVCYRARCIYESRTQHFENLSRVSPLLCRLLCAKSRADGWVVCDKSKPACYSWSSPVCRPHVIDPRYFTHERQQSNGRGSRVGRNTQAALRCLLNSSPYGSFSYVVRPTTYGWPSRSILLVRNSIVRAIAMIARFEPARVLIRSYFSPIVGSLAITRHATSTSVPRREFFPIDVVVMNFVGSTQTTTSCCEAQLFCNIVTNGPEISCGMSARSCVLSSRRIDYGSSNIKTGRRRLEKY